MPRTTIKYIEEELVSKIAMGDQNAFKRLFHLFYERLCRFAFLILHSKEQSEEAVLDVFLNVWIKREQLVPVCNIRSYLFTAVRNQAINYNQRANPVHSQENINVYELEIEYSEPSADEVMDLALFRERLQKAFEELPKRCRLVARMHFSDQLLYKEIAEILHVSPNTVKTQITIATQKIKEIFEKYGWNK